MNPSHTAVGAPPEPPEPFAPLELLVAARFIAHALGLAGFADADGGADVGADVDVDLGVDIGAGNCSGASGSMLSLAPRRLVRPSADPKFTHRLGRHP